MHLNSIFFDTLPLVSKQYNLQEFINDFLDFSLVTFSINDPVEKSLNQELLKKILAKYQPSAKEDLFAKMLTELLHDIDARKDSQSCPDILGEVYEMIFGESPFILSWNVCLSTAALSLRLSNDNKGSDSLVHIDPMCGTGRILLAHMQVYNNRQTSYGITPNPLFAKMAILNLFLASKGRTEIMLTGANGEFVQSYTTSKTSIGIRILRDKSESRVWKIYEKLGWKHISFPKS